MHRYEETVMSFLTRDPFVFMSPQFTLKTELGSDFVCPDFLAVDLLKCHVYIVEVSTSWNMNQLVDKLTNHHDETVENIKAELNKSELLRHALYRTLVFVRAKRVNYIKDQLPKKKTVSVMPIEGIPHPWESRYPEKVGEFWKELRAIDDISSFGLEDEDDNKVR